MDPAVSPGGLNPGSATLLWWAEQRPPNMSASLKVVNVTQYGKRDFASTIKFWTLRQGDPLGVSGGPTATTRILVRGRREGQDEKKHVRSVRPMLLELIPQTGGLRNSTCDLGGRESKIKVTAALVTGGVLLRGS